MKAKAFLKALGWLVSLLCLAYFVAYVHRTGLDVPGRSIIATATVVFAGAIVYGLSIVLLAFLWARLVPPWLPSSVRSTYPMLAAYLMGQFAKYLPGNVMHYVARHALGTKVGASHSGLASAALSETYLLLCTGAALATILGGATLGRFAPGFTSLPPAIAIIPLAAAFIACIPTRLTSRWSWIPSLRPRLVCGTLAGYAIFFLVLGVLYWACIAWTSSTLPEGQGAVGSAIVAWVAGFVLPGAPAGAGVREAALSAGADPILPGAQISSAIIMFRIITLGGDLLAFATGQLLYRTEGTRSTGHERRELTK